MSVKIKNWRKMSCKRRDSRAFREVPEKSLRQVDIVIKQSTMKSPTASAEVIAMLSRAIDKCNIENDIASYMKQHFDEKYGGIWHCIVGRNFGSHLDVAEHIHLSVSKISVVIFRAASNNSL